MRSSCTPLKNPFERIPLCGGPLNLLVGRWGDAVIESCDHHVQGPRRRPRLTLRMLMLIVALAGLGFAWMAVRARRVAVVDLGPPDLIAVGDRPHTLASLQSYIRASHVDEVVIQCPVDMPFDSLMRVVRAIQQGGLHHIRFAKVSSRPNPALPRPRPAVAAPGDIKDAVP
jgi:hypothetical protein